jgi:hypothetical protein
MAEGQEFDMMPNKRPRVDAETALQFATGHHWLGTTQAGRWTTHT